MFGDYAQIASYLAPVPESNAQAQNFGMDPLPAYLRPTYYPPHPWGRVKEKNTLAEDFVMIAEFSELEGPKPLLTIPKDGGQNFDHDSFSVRILAVDHQSSSEGFTITEDAQVVLSDMDTGVFAFVHHLVLFDNTARGFVRPYCMAYITTDQRKLIHFYEELSMQFKKVARYLKYGNKILFVGDLERHLKDLDHTKGFLLNQVSKIRLRDSDAGTSQGQDVRKNAENELYRGLQTIRQSCTEIKEILSILKPLMTDKKLEARFRLLEDRAFQKASPSGQDKLSLQDNWFNELSSLEALDVRGGSLNEQMMSPLSLFKPREYKPLLVETKKAKRFNAPLRGLHELCSWGAKEGLRRLRHIHEYFKRDSMILELEQNESQLFSPGFTNISHGHCISGNFMAGVHMKMYPAEDATQQDFWSTFSSHYRGSYGSESTDSFKSAGSNPSSPRNASPSSFQTYDTQSVNVFESVPSTPEQIRGILMQQENEYDSEAYRAHNVTPFADSDANITSLLPQERNKDQKFSYLPQESLLITERKVVQENTSKLSGSPNSVVKDESEGQDIEPKRMSELSGSLSQSEINYDTIDRYLISSDLIDGSNRTTQLLNSRDNRVLKVSPSSRLSVTPPAHLDLTNPNNSQLNTQVINSIKAVNEKDIPSVDKCIDEHSISSHSCDIDDKAGSCSVKEIQQNNATCERTETLVSSSDISRVEKVVVIDTTKSISNPSPSSFTNESSFSGQTEHKTGEDMSTGNIDYKKELSAVPEVKIKRDSSKLSIMLHSDEEQREKNSARAAVVTGETSPLQPGSLHNLSSDSNLLPYNNTKPASDSTFVIPTISSSLKVEILKRQNSTASNISSNLAAKSNSSPPASAAKVAYKRQLAQGSSLCHTKSRDESHLSCTTSGDYDLRTRLGSDASSAFTELSVRELFPHLVNSGHEFIDANPLAYENCDAEDCADGYINIHVTSYTGTWKPRNGLYTIGDWLNNVGPGRSGFCLCEVLTSYSNLQHVLFSLLTGRPVLVAAHAKLQTEVSKIVNALSTFVPAARRKRHGVFDWTTKPLKISDLSKLRLVGVCRPERKTLDSFIPLAIKRACTIFDLEKRIITAPVYQGQLITNLMAKKKILKNDVQFLPYVQWLLMEMLMKSFIFFHAFCLGSDGSVLYSHNPREQRDIYTSTVMGIMAKLGVKDSDCEIIEYLTEMVKISRLEPHVWHGMDTGSIVYPLHIQHKKCQVFRC